MDYIKFPWEQIGHGLRSLSLSGAPGNLAAWILYLSIGALPLAALLTLHIRQRAVKYDWLLAALSVSMYIGLWFFVNPTYMDLYLTPIPSGGLEGYTLAAVTDSLLLTWILLRVIVNRERADYPGLLRGLRFLLYLYILTAAAETLLAGCPEFIAACRELKEKNSAASGSLLTVSILFLALRFLVQCVPVVSELALLAMAAGFLFHFERESFGPRTLAALQRLRICSGRFLALILLSNAGFSCLQLLCSRWILNASHRLIFPLTEIIIISGIRLLSFLYLEGKRLKEDNDMFV